MKKASTFKDYQLNEAEGKTYKIFMSGNSDKIAAGINKIAKKYKKHEAKADSTPAAAGWGNTYATRSGFIEPIVNGNIGQRSTFLLGIKIGSNVEHSITEKIRKEVEKLVKPYEEKNTSDGGIRYDYTTGTNYNTVGLENSSTRLIFNDNVKKRLNKILNKGL